VIEEARRRQRRRRRIVAAALIILSCAGGAIAFALVVRGGAARPARVSAGSRTAPFGSPPLTIEREGAHLWMLAPDNHLVRLCMPRGLRIWRLKNGATTWRTGNTVGPAWSATCK
jgi:hypothetical protein